MFVSHGACIDSRPWGSSPGDFLYVRDFGPPFVGNCCKEKASPDTRIPTRVPPALWFAFIFEFRIQEGRHVERVSDLALESSKRRNSQVPDPQNL